jgi:septal ring factor EnvC (AmiA/AmiB activator)
MKMLVAGGSHSRTEKGRTVTYLAGQEIEVTKKEIEAFPGKFVAPAQPSEGSASRVEELEQQLKESQAQVKTLEASLKDSQTANADLQKELGKLQQTQK